MDTQQQRQYRILLVGDSCTDVYVFGSCNRISPEAPVPIFTKSRKECRDGMSSNVYKNLDNITSSRIFHLSNEKTRIKKIRFVDSKSNYQIMRYDIENEVSALDMSNLPDNIDVVVVSDYDKGTITRGTVEHIRNYYKCPIFVDTKKKDISAFKGCIVKLNEKEYESCVGKSDDMDLIVTLGSRGAIRGEKLYPTDEVYVHDVCGAGDIFLAALVSRWLETRDLDSAIMTANRCASYSVTKLGVYQMSHEEYQNFCV
jgi:D-beta-D-heptose 7-phosphate kinase/D-beta-D-heptose 1-phosphate adenosyltransferase